MVKHFFLVGYYDFASRYDRVCSPEQEKQPITLFSSPREGEGCFAPSDQPVHQEGQEEADQCKCKVIETTRVLLFHYSSVINHGKNVCHLPY